MVEIMHTDNSHLREASIVIDQQDRIMQWDAQAEKMFGWTSDVSRGRRLSDLVVSPEYCDFYLRSTKKFLKNYSSKFLNTEVEALDKQGRTFPVEMTVAAPSVHDRNEIVVFIRDLSVLRQAESVKGLLAAIVESSKDAIISLTMDGKINSWNGSAERIFGYGAPEIMGRNIDVMIPAELKEEQRRSFRQVQEGQLIDHYETVYIGKNQQYIDINITISPVRDTSGEITGASIIAQDITAKKIVETGLKKYLEDLERSNRDLLDFSHMASHDLKEPLRGLSNLSSFLLEDYKDKLDERGVRQLKQLVYLCSRMDSLISNLLYFSELGHEREAIQICNPHKVVAEIEQMMGALLKEKNAIIVIPSPMPALRCDVTRITEVFRNLITNAIIYNDKKNPVVEVGLLEKKETPQGMEKNVFYVKDNGPGIKAENFQAIFTMFKSFRPSLQERKSSGVGLAFAKKIIERHKGKIWVESELDKGTTFYFTVGVDPAGGS